MRLGRKAVKKDMGRKGIKQQIEDNPIQEGVGKLTKEHILELRDYIFKLNPNSKPVTDDTLEVVNNSEYCYFKYKGMTIGFEGFLTILNLTKGGALNGNIYYNGVLLEGIAREKFIKVWKAKNEE